jgi:hypothetical protein
MAAPARFDGARSRAGDNDDDFDFRCAKRQRNSPERDRFGLSELSSRSSPPPIVSGVNSSGDPGRLKERWIPASAGISGSSFDDEQNRSLPMSACVPPLAASSSASAVARLMDPDGYRDVSNAV